jgi:hypothetical protein
VVTGEDVSVELVAIERAELDWLRAVANAAVEWRQTGKMSAQIALSKIVDNGPVAPAG